MRTLRAVQFPEDDGPLAHPVRPESYIRIDNFYTPTVYNKGAELVRMIQTLIGRDGFRRGMDLYIAPARQPCRDDRGFRRGDGGGGRRRSRPVQAVVRQAGTPEITVEDRWDAASGQLRADVAQKVPPTPGQPEKRPMLIPLAMGLLGAGRRRIADPAGGRGRGRGPGRGCWR